MTSELKPCPFCGGEATFDDHKKHGFIRVCCDNLGCCMMPRTLCYTGADDAARAWNKRAERTCKVAGVYDYDEYDEMRAYELSCGHAFEWNDEEPPAYCPSCGAKVVE